MNVVYNGTFMKAKHDKLIKLVDAYASGAKASTKHLKLCFRGHSRSHILWPLKSWRGTAYYCIITMALESGTPLLFGTHCLGKPYKYSHKLIFLETRIIDLHFAADSLGLSSFKFFWWAP